MTDTTTAHTRGPCGAKASNGMECQLEAGHMQRHCWLNYTWPNDPVAWLIERAARHEGAEYPSHERYVCEMRDIVAALAVSDPSTPSAPEGPNEQ